VILDALAAIGGFYLASKVMRIYVWYFATNRDGNSGRSGHHWSEER